MRGVDETERSARPNHGASYVSVYIPPPDKGPDKIVKEVQIP